jgi:glycosyltransferase involved in cell wall biosynthesis
LRDELIAAYHVPADKVVTVHNGVEVGEYLAEHDRQEARDALHLDPQAPVLGTACRFAPQKGLQHLIDALPEVREKVPGVVLILGGDGPLSEELHRRAEDDGVAESIVWPGMVEDVPAFLSAIDASNLTTVTCHTSFVSCSMLGARYLSPRLPQLLRLCTSFQKTCPRGLGQVCAFRRAKWCLHSPPPEPETSCLRPRPAG